MDTLWGDFTDLKEEEDEKILDTDIDTGDTDDELKAKEEELKIKDVDNADKGKDTDKEDVVEDDLRDSDKKGTGTDEDQTEVTKVLESVSDLLEQEDLVFLDPETQYSGDAKGLSKMMRDNMEGQKAKLEKEFGERELAIRAEYESSNKSNVSEKNAEDPKQAEEMLAEYYKATGLEEEDIKEKLEILKDTDTVTKEAKIAQKYLSRKEEKDKEAESTRIKQEELDNQKAIDTYITELKTEIDSSENMLGFEMTNKVKKGFKSYLFDKDKDGLTGAQKAGKDSKRRLRIAFMDYMDYNKKDFEIKAKTEVSTELKKKTSRFTNKNAQTKGTSIEKEEIQEGFAPGFADFFHPGK